MFRCTTELKGLIIDADSFEEEIDWHIFDVHYKFFLLRPTNKFQEDYRTNTEQIQYGV